MKEIKSRKAEISLAIMTGLLILLIIVLNLVPSYLESVANADDAIINCTNSSHVYNVSLDLCCLNTTYCGINSTSLHEGLTTGQEVLLSVIVTLIVVGILVIGAKRLGFFGG